MATSNIDSRHECHTSEAYALTATQGMICSNRKGGKLTLENDRAVHVSEIGPGGLAKRACHSANAIDRACLFVDHSVSDPILRGIIDDLGRLSFRRYVAASEFDR